MSTARTPLLDDEILSRYLDAAKALAETSQDDGELGTRGAAAQQLLRRQARCMATLHEARRANTDCAVDEGLLRRRLDDLASICMTAFYSYQFDQVPYHWRRIYADTLILKSHSAILGGAEDDALTSLVENLDRALITAGGAGRVLGTAWIEGTFNLLERISPTPDRPATRFSTDEPYASPVVSRDHECPRREGWDMARFEEYMMSEPRPLVFTDLMDGWPALTDRPWDSPEYLLSRTLGGRRLVPIETGRSYVDDGWGQQLLPFKRFLENYVVGGAGRTGYLAQHDLFRQIPVLRRDICVPDLCWASVPVHPTRPNPQLDAPQLNAWFGPARTITPLHTDGFHNLLCQVVGGKYVRLYPPWETDRLKPRGMEGGVDMSNTSELDIGVIEGWDPRDGERGGEGGRGGGDLEGVEYWECVLRPGDALLIPLGWWHYVRSLSISFSVSFWWN